MGQDQKFLNDLKDAMKNKDSTRVLVLRSLISGLRNAKIEKMADLTKDEEIGVIKKEAKKRLDAIELYVRAKRDELVAKEEAELAIIKKYLPADLGEEEVKKMVMEMKAAGEFEGDFGKAMRLVMAKVAGKADGGMVSKVVREVL